MGVVCSSHTYLHTGVSAPIIILLWGINAPACLYFFKPMTILLGRTRHSDGAIVKHKAVANSRLDVQWVGLNGSGEWVSF